MYSDEELTNPISAEHLAAFPHYPAVPKDQVLHLKYRQAVRRIWRTRGTEFCKDELARCSRDCLYWINTYVYILEPRSSRVLPFNTYGVQDEAVRVILENLGKRDIGIDKSRDMGATWLAVTVLVWVLIFRHFSYLRVGSRKEDLVDRTGDQDTIFAKIDHVIRYLPDWMKPGRLGRSHMHIRNESMDTAIDGEATTANFGVGGRRLVLLLDEFAKFPLGDSKKVVAVTTPVTNCRMFVSTPDGAVGAFADMMLDPIVRMARLHIHWSRHPLKSPGLYTTDEHGRLVVIDPYYEFPPDYPFVLDGKLRSPWYDVEFERIGDARLAAQELDIEYAGSGVTAFEKDVIRNAIKRDARPPLWMGEVNFRDDDAKFLGVAKDPRGRLKVWCHLDAHDRPPQHHRYVIGCDIAYGTQDMAGRGQSNSVAQVYSRKTGEKVASLATGGTDPKTFAKMVAALGEMFRGAEEEAFLVWEANGAAGRGFGDEVLRLGYRNIFYRKTTESLISRDTKVAGWWSAKETKASALLEYQRAVQVGECVNRCEMSLRECLAYVITANGSWEHNATLAAADAVQGTAGHGDRVIADAVAWMAIGKVDEVEEEEAVGYPAGSAGERMEKARKQQRQAAYW